jgi:hypothetical protein
MCARRFLIAVFVLTLLTVAGAVAIFQWGGQLLIREATPKGHFEAKAAGSEPDYTDASSWIARPGQEHDPAKWLPEGASSQRIAEPAALFFIHPTTYLESDRWNAPIDDRESQDRAARSSAARQVPLTVCRRSGRRNTARPPMAPSC